MAVEGLVRPRIVRPSIGDWVGWLADHREMAWMLALVGVAAVAHAWNMFEFPYYESDEGTYLAQAWSVFHLGQLAPYTYWYDHPPLGWLVIARLLDVSSHSRLWHTTIAVGIVTACVVLAGAAFTVWARVTLGRNWSAEVTFKHDHELIESGPYALARHPIYTGLIVMALGTAVNYGRALGFALLLACARSFSSFCN